MYEKMALGGTWKEVKVKSGVLFHKFGSHLKMKKKQKPAVTVGNHWPKEKQWFRNFP